MYGRNHSFGGLQAPMSQIYTINNALGTVGKVADVSVSAGGWPVWIRPIPTYAVITYSNNSFYLSDNFAHYEVVKITGLTPSDQWEIERGVQNVTVNWPAGVIISVMFTPLLHNNMVESLSVYRGNKNVVMNGEAFVAQRGSTTGVFSSDTRMVVDRWIVSCGVGNIRQQTGAPVYLSEIQTLPAARMDYYSTYGSGDTANNWAVFRQHIEDVNTFASGNVSRPITLSFWARSLTAREIAVEFSQNFGDGGSSMITGLGIKKFNLATSWQKYTHTFTLPSTYGKTIGTRSYIRMQFWLQAHSTYNDRTDGLGAQPSGSIHFTMFQLEEGPYATTYERKTQGEYLIDCQRFYFKTYDLETTIGTSNAIGGMLDWITNGPNATDAMIRVHFPVPMFMVPTVIPYSENGVPGFIRNQTAGANVPGTADRTSQHSVYIKPTNNTDTTTNHRFHAHIIADADLSFL